MAHKWRHYVLCEHLYAAQLALTAEKKLNTGTNNAMIFLSDGQANVIVATADFPTSPLYRGPEHGGAEHLDGNGILSRHQR